MTDNRLVAEEISVSYNSTRILHDVSVAFPPGRITAILGPNGCGKSTLLRAVARLHPLDAGRVMCGDTDMSTLSRRACARLIGVLPQSAIVPDGVRVADLVARGRYPHQGWFGRDSSDDDAVVLSALTATGMVELAHRPVDELSGGQRQRAWVAMVLAQDTDILLLDEPTTSLDIAHQIDLLDVLAARNRERGASVIMVLHELALAARYADHLLVMHGGRIIAAGAPHEVLTVDTVRRAFGLESCIIADPVTETPMVVPVSTLH
ncbi:MAG: iron dicitrate ABC transporter ATP-binding protein [Candidatus Lumbricidophila eiseniae]|uniref:Iron dicitrate ABC transporter ATP-binding protein n=1 Tax=Candidatus Lumbricidiphila eiseniae TaxID=1969409 RepID=A0A2A6FSI1_9MICO|nr:MAG: iron dicitrate ABC transporter ATP-binding protein [Candidatus Lumbricidophila eiseniae]